MLYQERVAEINQEIVEGVTQELGQLTSFYLGVTNEWLEAMALTAAGNKVREYFFPFQIFFHRPFFSGGWREGVLPSEEVRKGRAYLFASLIQVNIQRFEYS